MKLTRIIILVLVANIIGLGSLFVYRSISRNNIKNEIVKEENSIIDPNGENKYTDEEEIAIGNDYISFGSQDNHPLIEVNNQDDSFIFVDQKIEGEITSIIDKEYFITAVINNGDEEIEVDYFIGKDRIIPFHKKQLTMNYTEGVVVKPEYLVIHETANRSIGANANAHYRYWSTNPNANASTHFVVDDQEIYQMLDLKNMAWHVGDNKGYSNIYNTNSIGIEICVNEDGDYMQGRENTIVLTALLMRSLDMEINQLKRHFDASGKNCPYYMLANPELWNDFVNQVEKILLI